MRININAFHFCVYVMLVSIICSCSIFDRQRMLTVCERENETHPIKKIRLHICSKNDKKICERIYVIFLCFSTSVIIFIVLNVLTNLRSQYAMSPMTQGSDFFIPSPRGFLCRWRRNKYNIYQRIFNKNVWHNLTFD